MPTINLSDETFIVASPAAVAAIVAEPARWTLWWPRLALEVYDDRGVKGVRWTVTGELIGSAELWVEPHLDGVVLHFFLRVDFPGSGSDSPRMRRQAQKVSTSYALAWKRNAWALKDELEASREPGTPPVEFG